MNSLFETLGQSLDRNAARIAVVNGDAKLTYSELRERANQFADALASCGITAGTKVALQFHCEVDFIVAFFAVQQLGAVACPVNIESTESELSQLLRVIEPDILIATAQKASPQHGTGDWNGLAVTFDEAASGCSGHVIAAKQADAELRDVALILCTSGTTGLPKAAMLTHENLVNNLEAFREHLQSFCGRNWLDYEVFGNPIPLSHPYGLIMMTLMPLYLGGATVQISKFSPRVCLRAIEQARITFFGGVPSMFAMLNRFRGKSDYDTSSCRIWISGGAPLPLPVAEEFEKHFGTHICEGFGMLETSSLASLNFETPLRHPGSIGPFHSRMIAEIRDEQRRRLPAGEIGDLWVSGPNIMKGYYRNPAATDDALQDGWLKTGDIGYFNEEGHYYLKGRSKEMVIVGGHNVFPAEVETVLLEHPQISDAAVAAEADLTRGERLLGFVVAVGAENIEQLQLAEYCRSRLSPYKVPRAFYAVSAIPRNSSGKIMRRALIDGLNAMVNDFAQAPVST